DLRIEAGRSLEPFGAGVRAVQVVEAVVLQVDHHEVVDLVQTDRLGVRGVRVAAPGRAEEERRGSRSGEELACCHVRLLWNQSATATRKSSSWRMWPLSRASSLTPAPSVLPGARARWSAVCAGEPILVAFTGSDPGNMLTT